MGFDLESYPSAQQRFPELFVVIDGVVEVFREVIDRGALPRPKTQLEFVRIAAVIRAFNLLKSVRSLLAADHWENAAILMRALFELALNIEELERDPAETQIKAEKFVRFEMLQKIRGIKAEADYTAARNGTAQHDPQLEKVVEAIPIFFAEWVSKRQDGSIRFATSWCLKTVKGLCSASGSPIRAGQYAIVYSFGSEMAHSSPTSVLSTHFQMDAGIDWADLVKRREKSERDNALLVMSLSIAFACEVVGFTHFCSNAFDPRKMLAATSGLYKLYGSKAPHQAAESSNDAA